jgi:hypothetical protein
VQIFESLSFEVYATDGDLDALVVLMEGQGFDPEPYGAVLTLRRQEPGSVVYDFNWPLNCDKLNLNAKDQFIFRFIAVDELNRCGFKNRDTLNVTVNVSPPDNTAPELTLENLSAETPYSGGVLNVIMGQKISLNLTATDTDTGPSDLISIELIDVEGTTEPEGYQFTRTEGPSGVQAPFTWLATCDIFQNNVFENEYTFTFRALDNRCKNIRGDTVAIDIEIKDRAASQFEFLPPNVITPNGDGCNDFFALEGFDSEVVPECGAIMLPNLPFDNCLSQFHSIRVYNRWGKEVFQSEQRNFRWYAQDEAAGVYFYTILYMNPENRDRNTEYKGSISVRN